MTNPLLTAPDLDAMVKHAHDRYRANHPASAAADVEARRVLPGGNTRSVLDFEPFPFRVRRAHGPELVDIDGHRYVDFCGNYTAGLLGHSPTVVKDAVADAMNNGWAIGATHEREVRLAELLCDRFPCLDQVRFTNSGTEANLMAIGTALHHTGRSGVGIFERAYHGGVLSFGDDAGGPHHSLNAPYDCRVVPFNEMDALDKLFEPGDLGCVLVEAVQGSGGCRPADREFLVELRRRCTAAGTVLIFDEVMTSRLAPGGAQELFGVMPDLCTLGKYLGGGMTFGAFGGRRDIMVAFDRDAGGTLTQAGTFNNNVASMAAAVATLSTELPNDAVQAVNDRGDRLRSKLNEALSTSALDMSVTGLGSMLCFHASEDQLLDLLFHELLDQGLYIARRGFVALSVEITEEHCEALVEAVAEWAKSVGNG